MAFVIVPTVTADGNWTVEVVDSVGYVGADSSITIDSNNRPHISYFDSTNNKLKYAKWTGSSWEATTVGDAGDSYTSIKLDSNGYPHISYWSGDTDLDLKYASWTGSSWSIETVDSSGDVGYSNCLALDSNNNPHIAYSDDTGPYCLKYAKKAGSSWEYSTVESGSIGCVSIDVDSSNMPHISYYGGSNALEYAKWTGSTWSIQTLDSNGNVGIYNSIALDSSNHPHISYNEYNNHYLHYVGWTGSAWEYATVDSSSSNVGMFNSIAVDSNGQPRISYVDTTNSNLKFAKRTGSAWSTEIVDSAPTYIGCTGLALDLGNNPHICYYDAASGVKDLKYAKGVSTDPRLSYSPTEIHFNTHEPGWTGGSTFEIWNDGGDTLFYTISEDIPWIQVTPSSGDSTGEHDSITVNVVDTGSMSGYYSGAIGISSNVDSGSVFVDITIDNSGNNNPPVKPQPPSGETSGESGVEYTYTAVTIDPDNDQIYYIFNWGDGTTSQTSFMQSGQQGSASHSWTEEGSYEIKVKAVDEHGAESEWSDPLPVTMPLNQQSSPQSQPSSQQMIVKQAMQLHQFLQSLNIVGKKNAN